MKEIHTKELAEKVKQGEDVNVVDVREDNEVAQGKIPGAKHIPLGEVEDRFHELDQDKHYYMVCRSGGRSGKASEFLIEKGYNVTNVDGGMLEWEDEVEK
ncbi:Rhodanese-related sulfurtransferase [Alteribacillus persepolensis]|uniref:Rhodanese-related sulfurtransferase n=1 Tax=Alteribacillus persepolensis TaxID=568899 RepID=A0A1G8FWQ9_9BACI|nr:rhodanese-like domain-containing protein [Alteribacillus persepolensis]SDH86505.1 Rhodanese-related sulfurtransferase [Alteribacillus persepolensis]